ncbi:MAG TPA: carboxylesterase, partial [Flavobacteriales bacterium]|nr:carboxylesterase [Flavobacteriales bacterium]
QAGFSQGGAIALQAGLRYERPLAGIMGLSTLLPLADSLAAEAADENRATPIMLAHGAQDPVIPIELAIRSRNALQQMDYSVDWFEYAMPHSVCMEELMDVRTWILECLA